MTKIKTKIKAAGLNQAKIARQLSLQPSTVCMTLKNGIRTIRVAKRYAAVIGCDWRELLD